MSTIRTIAAAPPRRLRRPTLLAWLLSVLGGFPLPGQTNLDDIVHIGTRTYRRIEFKVNAGGFDAGTRANVAALENGNFVVVWHGGVPSDAYARVYSPTGTALGSEFVLHPNSLAGSQYGASVGALPGGGFVAAWARDFSFVQAQRFDGSQAPLGLELTIADQVDAQAALDSSPDGEFVVALGVADDRVYAVRYDAAGNASMLTPVGGPVSGAIAPSVAYGLDGRFAIVWKSGNQIRAHAFFENFEELGPEFSVTTQESGQPEAPSVRYNSRRDMWVAWSGSGKADTNGVYARRFRDDGIAYESEFLVNETVSGSQRAPNLSIGANDEVLVSWVSANDVYGRLFNGNGHPIGLEFRLNGITNGSQAVSDLGGSHGNGILNNSNLVAAWAGDGTNGGGVYVTLFSYLGLTGDPEIVRQPQSLTVNRGANAEFCVTAAATPPVTYQWRKNGANLPNATNSCLTLIDVQPGDGGTYLVVVANDSGVEISEPARLTLNVPFVPAGDAFTNRMPIAGLTGLAAGTNRLATKEPGEPDHGGKRGGSSVWYTWPSPTNGIATFRTSGSDFDTLLGIYTGTNVAALVEEAGDEDKGGFLSSAVQFNARAGTNYQIAIDGFAGSQGDFLLAWTVEPTVDRVPRFTQQPQNITVQTGTTAVLSFDSPDAVLTQLWFHNLQPIPGATGRVLMVPNVAPEDVGEYLVRITNGAGRMAESVAATLEIGPFPYGRSVAKLQDLFTGGGGGGGRHGPLAEAAFGNNTPIISVAAGSLSTQTINNTNSTNQTSLLDCRLITSATRWIGLQPETAGTLVLDTFGSQIDTVLSVYTGNDFTNLQIIACDQSRAPEGIRGRVQFRANAEVVYSAKLDGANGAQGVMNLTWRLVSNFPPRLVPWATSNFTIRVGQTLVLTNVAIDSEPVRFTLKQKVEPAYIRPESGVFAWTPACSQGSSTNVFVLSACDNNAAGSLCAERTFVVVVQECVETTAGFSLTDVGATGTLELGLQSSVQLTNLSLCIPKDPRLACWTVLRTNVPKLSVQLQTNDPDHLCLIFSSPRGQVVFGPGPLSLATLRFCAISNQASAFVPVEVSSVTGHRKIGVPVANAFGRPGRVTVVGFEPLLEGRSLPPEGIRLLVYGQPEALVSLERVSELFYDTNEHRWIGFTQAVRFSLPAYSNSFPMVLTNVPELFYRAIRVN